MVIEILFIVCMFLWFVIDLPVSHTEPYRWVGSWLAFAAVLLLGLYLFLPGAR